MKLNIELTEEQGKHLQSMQWLIRGPIRSGRSYLMAVVYIQQAIDTPSRRVKVVDHDGHSKATQALMYQIMDIVNKQHVDIRTRFRLGTNFLIYK